MCTFLESKMCTLGSAGLYSDELNYVQSRWLSFDSKNRVFKFDYQKMNSFEFVRCLQNDVRVHSMFDKIVFV